MLNGIPFGSAGGIVRNGHGESEAVAELGLQFGFPGAGAATVAAASIGEDEQLAAAAVADSAVALPPAGDGVGGKGCRVMGSGLFHGRRNVSLAMVLLECLGDRVTSVPIQIFGTDISAVSIEKARAGVYSENSLAEVSQERLRRFFVKVESGFQIVKSLREMCVFARQDLGQDPPFSRLDLIS